MTNRSMLENAQRKKSWNAPLVKDLDADATHAEAGLGSNPEGIIASSASS